VSLGQRARTSISVSGVTPSAADVPFVNLGKTMTLPGCCEAPGGISGACANPGAATPRATASSEQKPAPFITTFILVFLIALSSVVGSMLGAISKESHCSPGRLRS
jgi:hypothetical protein